MESSIAGMLILGVLIVAVVLMSRAYVVSNTLLGTAVVESVNLADERSRTSLSIQGMATSSTGLTIMMKNTGSTSIDDYDDIDIFVGDRRLDYVTSTPTPGASQWAVSDTKPWIPDDAREIYVGVRTSAPWIVSSPSGAPVPMPTPTLTPTPTPTPGMEFKFACPEDHVATTTGDGQPITVKCVTGAGP